MAVLPLPAIPGAPVAPQPMIGNTVGGPPAQDPSYLAFLRASGASEDELRATIASKQDALNATMRAELPTFADQLRRQQGATEMGAQDRGMFQSGGRLAEEAQNTVTNTNDVNKLYTSTQNSQNDLENQLLTGLASQRQQQADQGLAARDSVATNSAGANTSSIQRV